MQISSQFFWGLGTVTSQFLLLKSANIFNYFDVFLSWSKTHSSKTNKPRPVLKDIYFLPSRIFFCKFLRTSRMVCGKLLIILHISLLSQLFLDQACCIFGFGFLEFALKKFTKQDIPKIRDIPSREQFGFYL